MIINHNRYMQKKDERRRMAMAVSKTRINTVAVDRVAMTDSREKGSFFVSILFYCAPRRIRRAAAVCSDSSSRLVTLIDDQVAGERRRQIWSWNERGAAAVPCVPLFIP